MYNAKKTSVQNPCRYSSNANAVILLALDNTEKKIFYNFNNITLF